MGRFTSGRLWLAVILPLGIALAGPAAAAEPAQKFLDALRQRGYFDEAVAYLEQLRTNPRAPKELQETIDYQLGVTLLMSAPGGATPEDRDQRMVEGQQMLERFASQQPNHALAATARAQAANVSVQRGRMLADEAIGQSDAGQRDKQLQSARKLLVDAEAALAAGEKQTDEALKRFAFVDPKDFKRAEARDQLRRDLLQAQLSRAWVCYEIARTYPAGGPEHQKALAEAAQRFAALYEKQRERLAGAYARIGQVRCLKDLGEPAKALAMCGELLAWPDEPEAFRTMKTKAAVLAVETARSPQLKKYKEAAEIARAWVESSGPADSPSEDALAIRYHGGEAALACAAALAGDKTEQVQARTAYIDTAREYLTLAAGQGGPYQQQAKLRLLDPLFGDATAREPATFFEARDRAKAAMDRMTAAETEGRSLAAMPNAAPARDYQKRINAARDEAIRYFGRALRLAAPDIAPEELNTVRYYAAYLHFKAGELSEAAALGDYLARKGGEGSVAREGARLALAAYDAMLRQSPASTDDSPARQRMVEMAEHITRHWGTQSEAEEARLVLLQAAAAEGRIEQAEQLLDQIRPESPRRTEAELSLGQALWNSQLRAAALPAARRPTPAETQKTTARAEEILTEALKRSRLAIRAGTRPTRLHASASLALAQASQQAGRLDRALRWLEDPEIGAKTLVDAGDPAACWGDFPQETYRMAFRLLVATREYAEAETTLRKLRELAAGDGEAERRLPRLAMALGRDIEEQVAELREQGKNIELKRLLQDFETFLARPADPRDTAGFRRLNEAAELYQGMGLGLIAPGAAAGPDAKKLLRKAVETYAAILRRAEENEQFVPQAEALVAVRIRLARCHRHLGEYREALGLLLAVLQQHTTLVDAQADAAYTYQAWAEEKPDYYEFAIQGGRKYREVWGWGQLAQRVQSLDDYRDMFHEARYNLALCRYRQALAKTEPRERDGLLAAAEQDVLAVAQFDPAQGGAAWRAKYDELLQWIRKARKPD